MRIKLKLKTCKNPSCKMKFMPTKPLQNVCDWKCALAYTNASKDKLNRATALKSRRETKEKLKKLDSLTDIANDVQKYFNQYKREKDKADGYGCISCGTTKPDIQYCAGHFRSRGATSALRFNEDNVWLQCNKRCNLMLSGNIGNYRIELVKRIGIDRVEALENYNTPKKWTKEELFAIKAKYQQLTKELKNVQQD